MRHYVAVNPRGHRQANPSKKALAIRSTLNHGHVVKVERVDETLVVPVRIHPQEALRRLEGLAGSQLRFGELVYIPTPEETPVFLIPPELEMYVTGLRRV